MLKDQKGIALLVVLLFIFSMAVVGVLGYSFGKKNDKGKQVESSPEPSASVKVTVSGNKSLDSSSIPEANTLYFGENEGEDAIFITNEKLKKYFEGGVEKSGLTIGQLRTETSGEAPYDFKNLVKPKKLLTLKTELEQINNFKLSSDGKFLFISLMLKTASSNPYPENLNNVVLKINMENLSNEEIWKHDLTAGKYGNARGAAYVEKISTDNSFLVLNLLECFACESSSAGQIVLNSGNKKEKYFEDIGNVLFQLSEGKFTYQKLEAQEESCSEGPSCDNGKRSVYKPSGETFTESLP
jgi:hypothetical protein